MQKHPPVYRAEFVLRPETDPHYIHFEDAADHPFEADSAAPTRRNVWWLADCALMSYWDEKEALRRFSSAGLKAEFLEQGSTECYVAQNATAAIVVFRGTESNEWDDMLTSANICPVDWDGGRGRVHGGFKRALDGIWPRLADLLAGAGDRRVWFSGHSLGGALATLAAYRFERTTGLCTFGSPRVGDRAFATAFRERLGSRSLRYVNNHDIITHVPTRTLFKWRFKHVDEARFIAANGSVSGRPPSMLHFFASLIGTPDRLLEILNAVRHGHIEHPPQCVLDHMPKAYALWTWNDYDRQA